MRGKGGRSLFRSLCGLYFAIASRRKIREKNRGINLRCMIAYSLTTATTLSMHIQHAFSRAHFHLHGLERRSAISQCARHKRIILRHGFDLVNFVKPAAYFSFLFHILFCRRENEGNGFINVRLQNLHSVRNSVRSERRNLTFVVFASE